MKPKVDFLKRQQIDKRLAGLTKGKKWRLKLLKPGIKEEALLMILQGNRIEREYCEQLYAHKLDNLDEMDKFLEIHILTKFDSRRKKIWIDL